MNFAVSRLSEHRESAKAFVCFLLTDQHVQPRLGNQALSRTFTSVHDDALKDDLVMVELPSVLQHEAKPPSAWLALSVVIQIQLYDLAVAPRVEGPLVRVVRAPPCTA